MEQNKNWKKQEKNKARVRKCMKVPEEREFIVGPSSHLGPWLCNAGGPRKQRAWVKKKRKKKAGCRIGNFAGATEK